MKKVWVFQSKREFSKDEISFINDNLHPFITQWKAHGNELSADFTLQDNRFIKVQVDEEMEKASGCSIDSLTRKIKEIDNQFQLGLLDRNLISFIENNDIKTISLFDFKKEIKSGNISDETIFYNMAISNSDEFQTQFKIKIKDSWAKNLLAKEAKT